MLASSSKLFIPFVCLFIATSSLVQSHELPFNRRDHSGSKRFLKNRSLSTNSDSQISTSAVSQSTVSASPQTTPSLASTLATSTPISISIASSSNSASSQSTSSITSSSISSSTITSASSSSTSTSQTSPSVNLSPVPVAPSTNVVASTITSTQSLSATASETSVSQVQSLKTKSTTVTALIAVAASVGGIAILWTIFRKWKLSSSKEFDRRLNPITDWQPTNGDDDSPALRRAPSSSSSFRSGGGSANGHPPLDHDFTAGSGNSAPVGGYADLARASSPNPPIQQALGRGPSFNYGYNVGVPLHHQTGYGTYDAYDYGGGARY